VSTPVSSQSAAGARPIPEIPLPNFFLVGAPKAGTTSLYHYLDQHPQIYMSPVKEPHYFSEEIRFENFTEELQSLTVPKLAAFREYIEGPMSTKFSAGLVADWADYVRLFRGVRGEAAIGEASVSYLWSPTAAHNIARHFPEARILIMLRNPVELAFSNYLAGASLADSYFPFHGHVEAALKSKSTRIGKLYPFLEFGLYYEQVRRYFALFPRECVGVHLYDEYVREPARLLQDIFRFLHVDTHFVPNLSRKHMQPRVPRSYFAKQALERVGLWQMAGALMPSPIRPLLRRIAFQSRSALQIDPADRARLLAFYRDDIRKLADLLGRDLSAWLRPG
jgi:hypothetical protein